MILLFGAAALGLVGARTVRRKPATETSTL
jgi:hypothetical protein